MTFRNLSYYRPSHERTYAQWLARAFDFVTPNHAVIVEVVPQSHKHILAFDPSCVPKSGQSPYSLDLFVWAPRSPCRRSRTWQAMAISAKRSQP
jgi:hypothetical protein